MTRSSHHSLSRIPTVLGVIVLVGVLFLVFQWIKHKNDRDPAAFGLPGDLPSKAEGDPSSASQHSEKTKPPPGSPGATPSQTAPAPPIVPAEQSLSGNVTREVIADIRTSAQAAQVHRILTTQLFQRLEELSDTKDRERVRVATQELADRFYLLDRVVTQNNLEEPGAASLDDKDKERIEALLKTWQTNMELSLTVDLLFSQRGLLSDEHVPQMFRRWMHTRPELDRTED